MFQTSLVLLLALVRRVQEEVELPAWRKQLPTPSNLSLDEVQSICRKAHFAFATYSASWSSSEEEVAKQMGVDQENVVLTWCRDEEDTGLCPKFIVLMDHESKAVVLAIRGTFCLRDVLLDMVCDDAPFLDGFAHKGIREGAEAVWAASCPALLSALALHPSYHLHLTGHSLGAGVAVLLALELLLGDGATTLPPGTEVHCLALAPPPVFRAGPDPLPPWVVQQVVEVVHHRDCVPRTSLAGLATMLATLRAVDSLQLSFKEIVSALGAEGGEVRSRVVEALEELQEKEPLPLLQHPGRLLYLEEEDGEGWTVRELSQSGLGQLMVVAGMVTDHSKEGYEEALAGLKDSVIQKEIKRNH